MADVSWGGNQGYKLWWHEYQIDTATELEAFKEELGVEEILD